MGRDPTEGDAVVFDLVEGDAVDVPSPAVEGSGNGPGGTPAGDRAGDEVGDGAFDGAGSDTPVAMAPFGPVRWLRPLVPIAAVVAIAVGTGFALEGVRDAERMDRIREVNGGVVDLSAPLEEVWQWEGDVGSGGPVDDWGMAHVAALGGLLAFVSGDELLALDPATGAEMWAIPLGDDPDCGPAGYPGWDAVDTETVVCLQGRGGEREVMTVGPEGVVSGWRPLDAADTRRYGSARPGPDGTVLRADRVGPVSAMNLGDAACSPSGDCTGTVESGRDIRLRAEDAATGAERWTVSVPFRATAAEGCNVWMDGAWGGVSDPVTDENLLQPDLFGARIGSDVVALYGCGAGGSVTSDGVLFHGADQPAQSRVTGLSTGGYVAAGLDLTTSSVLYSADGAALMTADGSMTEALVTTGAGTLLGWDDGARGVRAYAPDGTLLWDRVLRSEVVLFAAEVGETAVVLTDSGAARGLNLATGEQRWTQELSEGADEAPWGAGLFLLRAFTDGRHVLLLLSDEAGSFDLVSLDTVSGDLVWEEPMADTVSLRQSAALLAVGGHLLALSPSGVHGLG
ncbi:PQQ-binding-like beta-propeller repeat protein [Promicromonospora iranensis]|uniref:Outer membrane protein assembly factor BamB n=1 Tax=Promicromonospora iranensis TaxID=1105144 RepID=A0ABU2CP75_9MICO|nr:PQQ-binding-like beta-propeller repeat protein [Promicromonospora iranensis]MDR7383144.1 outer membrane protein assembly factor BamB [Promicromonospora iranensis]